MDFVKDMYHDEIRDGWLVNAGIKKAWNKMLEAWQEIDRICRKYRINYWAYAGTLLGAARHRGFVPWDTDMDLCMLRPEYNIFCDAAERELIKGDSPFEIERRNFNNFRIALKDTSIFTADDFRDMDFNKTHGMQIEVYPLDIARDETPPGNFFAFKLIELICAGDNQKYAEMKERTENGQRTLNDWQTLENFHALSERGKQDFYRNYAALSFSQSSKVGWIEDIVKTPTRIYSKEWFGETTYLPFETVELPAPVDYDKVLSALYGDWHKFVYDHHLRLGYIHSTDIPYKEFLERVDLEFLIPSEEST